jgi:hypothetical protein
MNKNLKGSLKLIQLSVHLDASTIPSKNVSQVLTIYEYSGFCPESIGKN